jgi:myo-inositol 2-dehydrogenase/D-chiro-inositol 1-dehydrogenase
MAVIGCGPIGTLHARAITTSPRAALVALCEVDAKRRDVAAQCFDVPGYEGVAQMLTAERLDAVAIATPDHLHLEPALAAIAAGCHVFCEKPLAASAAEGDEIVRAAADRGVSLGVDYNRRFAFGYQTAKRLLGEGTLGTLLHGRIKVRDRTPPAAVIRHPLVIFTTLLTHHFDLLRHFAGEVRTIRAVPAHQPIGNLLRDVMLSLEFSSGATGRIEAGYRDELTGTVERMELDATAGAVVVEDVSGPVTWFGRDRTAVQSFSPPRPQDLYDSLIAHVQAFIDNVSQGALPPVTGHDGLMGMRLAEAAIQSIHSGEKIEVSS